jgi:hypothetical protein
VSDKNRQIAFLFTMKPLFGVICVLYGYLAISVKRVFVSVFAHFVICSISQNKTVSPNFQIFRAEATNISLRSGGKCSILKRMKDSITLAYINMYGILGALPGLCAFVPEAKALAENAALPGGKPLSVGFAVKSGPAMTLRFADGACAMKEGAADCDIRLPFADYEKFNGLIDGTVTPFPSKGFTKLKFLTGNFFKLTKILENYLRPAPEALGDQEFFIASTKVMFFLIARAVAQIGNHDKIGRFTASNLVDGTAVLSIAGAGPGGTALQAAITVKDHVLSVPESVPEHYQAIMEFESIHLARKLFDGQVSALGCVGQGLISMRGNLGMLDNVNRILDRVAVYLA